MYQEECQHLAYLTLLLYLVYYHGETVYDFLASALDTIHPLLRAYSVL